MSFEGNLASEVGGVGGCASPVAVGLGGSFESLDRELLGEGSRRRSILGRNVSSVTTSSGGIQILPSTFEFAGVEGRGVVQEGLLAGV